MRRETLASLLGKVEGVNVLLSLSSRLCIEERMEERNNVLYYQKLSISNIRWFKDRV